MNELKKQLMNQLGLDEGASQRAINLILGFVEDRLPLEQEGLIDKIIGDDGPAGDPVPGLHLGVGRT